MSTLRSTLLLTATLTGLLAACGGEKPSDTDTASTTNGSDASTSTDDSTDATSSSDSGASNAEAPDAEAPRTEAPEAEAPQDPPESSGENSGEGEGEDEAEATEDSGSTEPDIADPQPYGDGALDKLVAFVREQKIDRSKLGWRTRLPEPPFDEVEFDESKTYYWNLTTNQGPLKFRFLTNVAPRHVANAAYLSMTGFYDNLDFHRVLRQFMAQGGCPNGDGSGDPGYSIDGEFSEHARHDRRGLLSAANSGPGTDGSQFFILFGDSSHLNDKHTVYGGLVEGRGTLRKMEKLAADGATIAPSSPIIIESATVEVVGRQ